MGTAATERVAVMAIHPRYAEAILAGEKLVEFRKRKLAEDVTTVLIYATVPVQQVIGEFSLKKTDVDEPAVIWARYGHAGLIDKISFGHYYANSGHAVALLVDKVIRYAEPRSLTELDKKSIPQSFYYVNRLQKSTERKPSSGRDTRPPDALHKKVDLIISAVSVSHRPGISGDCGQPEKSQLVQQGRETK